MKGFGFEWITPTGNPTVILAVMAGVAVLISLLVVASYHLRRWQRHRRFLQELNLFALEENEGSTLIDLVKRYATDEPVEVLYSLRMFDELAEKEMNRVLGLQGSRESKQQYIDLLYAIRQKTYFAEIGEEASEPTS
jgi:hypothetical protein